MARCVAGFCVFIILGLSAAAQGAQTPNPAGKAVQAAPETAKKAAEEPADGEAASALAELRKRQEAKRAKPTEKPNGGALIWDEDEKPGKSGEKKSAKKEKGPSVLRIVLKGECSEGPAAESLFSEDHDSLADVLKRLDRAATDPAVVAVLLEFEDLDVGSGKIYEIREAIAKIRKAGRPVYALLTSSETGPYLIALACDEIVMPPTGSLMVPGVRAEMTFYKGLLDKVGLQYDVLQMGKYKGAGEPYTRTAMSPDFRKSMEALVDDSFQALLAMLAKDRKIEPAEAARLVDEGLFTADAAKKARLIDHVMYFDEFQELLRGRLKLEKLKIVSDAKKKVEGDASMSGLLKLMEKALDAKDDKPSGKHRKIAVIYAVGIITDGESSVSLFGGQTVGSDTLVAALRQAADDPQTVAIVLRIDSPGGSAIASDLIWREIAKIKKPIIASMGDTAASGGYYIAMGTRKIIAEPGTVTGSIGVIGGKMVLGGLFEKVGITTDVISRGRNSGTLSSTRPFSEDERKAWTRLLEDTYRQFVDKAAKGRRMPFEKLEALAQGRVYTGRMAVANGLVDKLGTLSDAVAEAKQMAGVKEGEEIDLWILPKSKSLLERLLSDGSLQSSQWIAALPGGRKVLAHLEALRRLGDERVLLLMPSQVEMK